MPDLSPLKPGLYLVATPIGSARDITLRALDILAAADVIAAEDTRTARKLMTLHGISAAGRELVAYHDHSGPAKREKLMDAIAAGNSVAYVSEAGTPLVADPGFVLLRDAIERDLPVTTAPGASAVLTALAVAGMPTDRFFFAGFLPSKSGARTKELAALKAVPSTTVFYESPRRIAATLGAMIEVFGPDRPVAICRELTKKFEQTARGTLDEIVPLLDDGIPLKGEFVIVLGPPALAAPKTEDLDAAILDALTTQSIRDASAQIAADLDLPRKKVFQRALALSK